MKREPKVKPVRAWALCFGGVPSVHWIYPTRAVAQAVWDDCGREHGESLRQVDVYIRPAPKRKKRKAKR